MKRTLVPAVVLASIVALAACSNTDEPAHDMATMSGSASPSAAQSAAADAQFNDADETFASMMIPHHQQAIEMSDELLAKDGIDPEVADLATQIKQAQGPEITTLQQWLTEWGAPTSSEHSGHSMDSMMSEDDMKALEAAEGAEASRLFLEQMVVHHRGAIEMAQTEVAQGTNQEAVEMAQSIVDSQRDEVATMEQMLAAM